ncbi:hypothetical protein [Paraburkholderia dipogonis]|uniref:hypothetical protein n=1 Tax=Paraburkholderia dipogonis TaxID=1211383 RepID=UPI0038BDCD49
MEPNQTNAAAKLMPLFHAIQSEIASQVMKDPGFKFDFKTAIDNCQIEVNFPHLTGASASPAKPVPTDHAAAMDAAARSAAMPKVSDADRAVMQAAFDAKPKKIPKL